MKSDARDFFFGKYGRLTVVSFSHNGKGGRPNYKCRCECGEETIVCKYDLISGHTKSCGCIAKEKVKGYWIELTGQKYGRLTVEGFAYKDKNKPYWNCICECGNKKIAHGERLKSGAIKSCGCLAIEVHKTATKTHGMSKSLLWGVWNSMISRCYNLNHIAYVNYGKRGIRVCKKWRKFAGFYEDMGECYKKGLTLERIDVNKGYHKNNCKWATRKEQARNKRNSIRHEIEGKNLTVAEWADISGIPKGTIHARLRVGWEIKKAIFHPKIPQSERNIGGHRKGI